jgi:hypothetical protein
MGAVSAFVTRHQHLIAAVLVVALMGDLLPSVDYPSWLVELLGIAAAALGISRPTEVAATSLKQRGGFIATGLAAYLVAAAQSDEATEPRPEPAAVEVAEGGTE